MVRTVTILQERIRSESCQSPEEIILKLSSTTCRNITNLLDEQSCDSMPTFHGGFGNVYYGRLTDETSVAVKCVRMPSQRAARNHTVSGLTTLTIAHVPMSHQT